MSDTLPTREMRGFDSRGKFAKGNSLARENPLNRLAQSMRAKAMDLDGNPVPEIDRGQLQFHMAPHVIRTCAPGKAGARAP